jgi:hypothetical protein
VKFGRKIIKQKDFILVFRKDNRFKFMDYEKAFKYRGYVYHGDTVFRKPLLGWRPDKKKGFFSDLMEKDGITRTMILFREPPEPAQMSIDVYPLDRLREVADADGLTPHIHKLWMESSLFRERMRKMKVGGMDLRIVLVAVGIVGFILALLYFSGYYG